VSSIITVVLGFFQICCGVVLLQLSKSAKDVPDAAIFKGDLDQIRTVAEQEEPESEPKADAIRGAAAIVRRFSKSRQKMEAEEAFRVHEDRMKDMQPIAEDEQVRWDGLRRRTTVISREGTPFPFGTPGLQRSGTIHPPLGMSHFPDPEEEERERQRTNSAQTAPESGNFNGGFVGTVRNRARTLFSPGQHQGNTNSPMQPVQLSEIAVPPGYEMDMETPMSGRFLGQDTAYQGGGDRQHAFGIPDGLRKPQVPLHGQPYQAGTPGSGKPGTPVQWADGTNDPKSRGGNAAGPYNIGAAGDGSNSAKRQFSFQNIFHRRQQDSGTPGADDEADIASQSRPKSRLGMGSRGSSHNASKGATEEERLGLVKGDSRPTLPKYQSIANLPEDDEDGNDYFPSDKKRRDSSFEEHRGVRDEEKERKEYEKRRNEWRRSQQADPAPGAQVRRRSDDEDDEGRNSEATTPLKSANFL
jgi:magnesium transporter